MKTTLFAASERRVERLKHKDPLSVLSHRVDFVAIAQSVDEKLQVGTTARGGRPAWPTEVMIRLLLLQQLYNLSDDALEYQLLDRHSFVQFAGLQHSPRVPDAKTIWLWRERLKQAGLMEAIMEAVNVQLKQAGLVARGGQMIDASIVNAPVQRNTREENAQIKQGEVPEDWSRAKRSQKDVDARWTKKHGKSYYGYKLHANVDRRHGLIRQHEVSPAHEHDSQHCETLLDPGNTRKRLLMDSAYADKQREAALKEKGYQVDICRKGARNHPLSAAAQRRNRRISKDRVFVEHAFARVSQMGGKCLRTIGLARAKVVIGLKVAMHNLLLMARTLNRREGAPA